MFSVFLYVYVLCVLFWPGLFFSVLVRTAGLFCLVCIDLYCSGVLWSGLVSPRLSSGSIPSDDGQHWRIQRPFFWGGGAKVLAGEPNLPPFSTFSSV